VVDTAARTGSGPVTFDRRRQGAKSQKHLRRRHRQK